MEYEVGKRLDALEDAVSQLLMKVFPERFEGEEKKHDEKQPKKEK